jgi:hypothetical protein
MRLIGHLLRLYWGQGKMALFPTRLNRGAIGAGLLR